MAGEPGEEAISYHQGGDGPIYTTEVLAALELFKRERFGESDHPSRLFSSNLNHDSSAFVFFPLCRNKYGDCIGGVIAAKKPNKGRILILPQFRDKVRAVYELVTTVLPEMSRHLFPDSEGERWVQSDTYEHPSILERKATK